MALFGMGKKKEETSAGMAPDMGMPAYPEEGYGAPSGQYSPEAYPPAQGYPPGAVPEQQGFEPAPVQELSKEEIEEIAEAIVDEKWKEEKQEIDKVMEWKEEVTSKLSQLQQQIDDLKSSFDSLHKGILGKISEYDENLINVGTEIKAMEKVFSKVLPSLTDSVSKMQRMASGSGVIKKK